MINDQLANALAAVKNGYMRRKVSVKIPYITFVASCMDVLSEQEYVGRVEKISDGKFDELKIELIYNNITPVLADIKKISKCSLRKYTTIEELKKIIARNPNFLYVVSTNKGVMDGERAIAEKVCGELLFKARCNVAAVI